jgi:hypothetical protein
MQKAPDGLSEAFANVTMLSYFALTVTGTLPNTFLSHPVTCIGFHIGIVM